MEYEQIAIAYAADGLYEKAEEALRKDSNSDHIRGLCALEAMKNNHTHQAYHWAQKSDDPNFWFSQLSEQADKAGNARWAKIWAGMVS